MPRWLLTAVICLGCVGPALAQSGSEVNSGLNGEGGSFYGPNVDVVNGINPNGTPRQQSPGSSMTNGAGNSAMTPNVTGAPPTTPGLTVTIPKIITQGSGTSQ